MKQPSCAGYVYAICKCSEPARASVKRRRKKARKVCEPIDLAGQRYEVVSKDHLEGNLEGQCLYDENLIELLEAAEDRMADALLHEMGHGVLDAGGGKHLIRSKHRLSVAKYSALEEDFIRALVPGFLSALRAAGWLKLPKLSRRGIFGRR